MDHAYLIQFAVSIAAIVVLALVAAWARIPRQVAPLDEAAARTIIADHSRSLSTGKAIARQNNIPLQLAPGDTSGMHGYMMVNRLEHAGSDFDRVYLGSQIRLHQHMLAELEALRTTATSTAVRQHILDDIEPVQRHLDTAQHLAASLGYTYTTP